MQSSDHPSQMIGERQVKLIDLTHTWWKIIRVNFMAK